MDSSLQKKHHNRKKRALRNRFHLRGTSEKPRLCVLKSNKHIHVQLIDDEAARTIASTSTISEEFRGEKKNKEAAKKLGKHLAKVALTQNIKQIIFDRGPFKFHGVLAALADGAREGGLEV